MKTIFTSLSLALLFLLTPIVSFAQVPEGIHYQATIRDAGNLVANQSVTVEFTIWETVVPIYRETQVLTTNAYGHLSAQVGAGTSSLGNFSDVDWTIADHFLQARVDLGSGFVDLGLSEMLSVPFAQHAGIAAAADFGLDGLEDVSISSPGNGQVLTWNGSNWEAQTPSTGTTYTAGSGINISGSVISNTGDVNASDDLTIGSNASGDLSGTYPAPEVSSIRGQAVSAAAPSNGEVLKWNGSAWTPAQDNAGSSLWTASGSDIYYNGGNIGVGTTSPTRRLNLVSGGNNADVYIEDSFPFVFLNSTTGTGNAGLKFEDQGGYTGWIYHHGGNDAIYISGRNSGTATPDLVAAANGNIGIGTASPSFPLHMTEDTMSINGLEIANLGSSNLGLDGDVVPYGGSSLAFDLGNNTSTQHWDDVVASGFITYSDYRLKNSVEGLKVGLKEIMQLRPVQYKYNLDIDVDGNTRYGLIAQEVEPLLPDVVVNEDVDVDPESGEVIRTQTEYKAMNYVDLVPVLIKAVQEQQQYIEKLEKRIEKLEE